MNCKACCVEIEELESLQLLSNRARLHLESCLSCRGFRDAHLALKKMIDSLEVITAPADFDFRLRARLAATTRGGHGQIGWGSFAPRSWALAIVAAFVVILAVGLMIRQSKVAPSLKGGPEKVVKVDSNSSVDSSVHKGRQPVVTGAVETPLRSSNDGTTLNTAASSGRFVGSRKDVKSPLAGTALKPEEEIRSADFGTTPPANSVLPPGIPDPLTRSNSFAAIPIRSAVKPTTITFTDAKAKSHSILLRPVTLGGQDAFEPENEMTVLMPTTQGIW
jgi:hypothetical protein